MPRHVFTKTRISWDLLAEVFEDETLLELIFCTQKRGQLWFHSQRKFKTKGEKENERFFSFSFGFSFIPFFIQTHMICLHFSFLSKTFLSLLPFWVSSNAAPQSHYLHASASKKIKGQGWSIPRQVASKNIKGQGWSIPRQWGRWPCLHCNMVTHRNQSCSNLIKINLNIFQLKYERI